MKSKLLPALLAVAGMASAGSASAIIVGGINFQPAGVTVHLETTTVAEDVVNAVGQTLTGYGVVNTVNGAASYCAVDPLCRLFFTFTYTVSSFTPTHVEFTGGVVNFRYDPGTGGADTGFQRILPNFTSAANLAYINSLAGWVQLTGHDNSGAGPLACLTPGATLCADGTLTGTSLSFTGQGLLDVALGGFGLPAVQAFWNDNAVPDFHGGFADIALGSEGNTLVHSNLDTCSNPPLAGEFCIQGSASIRGPTVVVPEPATLLLLGIGLIGVGFGASRRKNVA